MKVLLRKSLSVMLCMALILSTFIFIPTTARAASYRDDFIEALLDNEDFWYEYWGASVGYNGAIAFADLNFDGKLELIMQYGGGSMLNCDADAFYFDGNTIYKASSDGSSINDSAFQNTFDGYYDTVNKKYRLLGSAACRNGVSENWTGKYELFFDGNKVSTSYYSARHAIDKNWSGNYTYTYYNGAKSYCNTSGYSKISEAQYNTINENKMKNLVDINMHLEFIDCYQWEKYGKSSKRSALQRSYDGFTYDKYDEPTVIIGDADGDGDIGITDATEVQLIVASIKKPDETAKKAADADKDGAVSIMDATEIQRFVAKIITEF